MTKKLIKLTKVKCLRCGYKWSPRTEDPKVCAGCGSVYWNTPRRIAKDKKVKLAEL